MTANSDRLTGDAPDAEIDRPATDYPEPVTETGQAIGDWARDRLSTEAGPDGAPSDAEAATEILSQYLGDWDPAEVRDALSGVDSIHVTGIADGLTDDIA